MRVLYFTHDNTPHDRRFLTALSHSGHEIYYLRLENQSPRRDEPALPEGIIPIAWRGGTRPARLADGPALWADLKAVLRRVKPDVIHAGPLQSAAFLAALSGFEPLVSMSWGSDILVDAERNPAWRWATRCTLSRTRVFLGDCLAVQRKAVELGFPAERVVLFPWGVDLDHFSPGDGQILRRRWGWEDNFVLLCNRSWEPLYGVDVIARGFAAAAKTNPDLRLALLGGGSQVELIRAILEEGGVLDRVVFPGRIDLAELPEYYRAADLYLSASHSDGSSVSLLEALACGRMALVSDIAGNREWIAPGQTGWLFPDDDSAGLADGILRAASLDTTRRSAVEASGRTLVEERADWSKNVQKLLDAYQMAVDMKS